HGHIGSPQVEGELQEASSAPNTASVDTTVVAPALNTVAAPLYGHGQAPGMDTLAGCQPHAENVKYDGTGAAGSRASAGQQPGYALLVPSSMPAGACHMQQMVCLFGEIVMLAAGEFSGTI